MTSCLLVSVSWGMVCCKCTVNSIEIPADTYVDLAKGMFCVLATTLSCRQNSTNYCKRVWWPGLRLWPLCVFTGSWHENVRCYFRWCKWAFVSCMMHIDDHLSCIPNPSKFITWIEFLIKILIDSGYHQNSTIRPSEKKNILRDQVLEKKVWDCTGFESATCHRQAGWSSWLRHLH